MMEPIEVSFFLFSGYEHNLPCGFGSFKGKYFFFLIFFVLLY